MSDAATLDSPPYLPTLRHSGDGLGIPYTNWDKSSVVMCNCDAAYFGADCSLVMCPKGDDPWTNEQNDRTIKLHVISNISNVPLSGVLGIQLYGVTSYISLSQPTDVNCVEGLQNSTQIGTVACNYTVITGSEQTVVIQFLTWPEYTPDNNIFINNGNPSIDEFYCDVSQSSAGVLCYFTDVINYNIKGNQWNVFTLQYQIYFVFK